MSQIKNEIILHNEYVEIKVTKTGLSSYTGHVLLDIEDLPKVGKVRISNTNYAYTCKDNVSVAHIIMNHTSNMQTVVDHINGNRLDNRKNNLRIVTQAQNACNRTVSLKNNTGCIGIQQRKNGKYNYYRATVSDRKTKMKYPTNKTKTKQISKQFNISKLGKETAFLLAKKWLIEKRQEFGY